MQKERSISAVYYLLQGKQSIQTIQDAQLFGLTEYFGVYKNLTKRRFFVFVNKLVEQKLLQPSTNTNFYYITDKGKKRFAGSVNNLEYLSGFRFRQFDQTFFYRLLLLIQVLTNSKKRNFTYIPIIENIDIENWVKMYYQHVKEDIDNYLKRLHDELTSILKQLPFNQPSVFLDQITSYHIVGLTANQTAKKLQMNEEDIHLITTNVIHLMLATIIKQQQKYPYLYSIGKDLFSQILLTQSADRTRKLLEQQYTIEEIAQIRHLKINTIYDHVVEIALSDQNFSLIPYISKVDQQEIIQAIRRINSYKLKDIKEAVNENISYFQIRLVLTQINNFNSGSVIDESIR